MDWRLKALAFRALDLPGGDTVHYWLQRHVLRSWPRPALRLASFPPRAQGLIDDCVRHLGRAPESVLEIGAGRDLALPLCLRRLGVGLVLASDVTRLARLDLVRDAAMRLGADVPELTSWDDLDRYGVCYRAPHLVSAGDEPVDLSCSNEVLEHVPAAEVPALLAALRGVTRGITVHTIDYSDHYARSDAALSRLNFLRYSDAQWRWFDGRRQHLNRLRHSDYLGLFREAGFAVVDEQTWRADALPERIAARFAGYDRDDLLTVRGRIVAR